MNIGVFGGTFDPIHFGHLLLAEQAMELVPLDEVWFIPTGEPPHKKGKKITEAEHRYQMVLLATQDHPYFRVSRLEMERKGPSYTIDTLQTLKEMYPNDQFFLLVGADMVKDLPRWYKIKEILQFVHIVGLGRLGVKEGKIPDDIHERLTWIPDAVETNISSTTVRERLAHGKSIRYMVPEQVRRYIKENRLYGS
jgi:nicotinate-nucleotide adenylyltransferase